MKIDGCKTKTVHFEWQAVTSHAQSKKEMRVLLDKYMEYLQTREGRMDTSTYFEGEHSYMLVGQ